MMGKKSYLRRLIWGSLVCQLCHSAQTTKTNNHLVIAADGLYKRDVFCKNFLSVWLSRTDTRDVSIPRPVCGCYRWPRTDKNYWCDTKDSAPVLERIIRPVSITSVALQSRIQMALTRTIDESPKTVQFWYRCSTKRSSRKRIRVS